MKKKALLFLILIGASAVLVAGVGYALGSKPSDVSRPLPTPHTDLVKYHVLGSSMEPTINDGDWLTADVDKKGVARGDIVILRYPKDESTVYCRRIVAVAGDRVVMKYYSNVKITTVFSPAHPQGTQFPAGVIPNGNAYGEYDASVTSGNYYVIGDNAVPGGSYDSDEWGLLPSSDIVGTVTKRLSPSPRVY